MRDSEDITALLPFYVLGALTEEEEAQVEAYLDDHPQERERLLSQLAGAADVAFEATPMEPSEEVKEALMRRVHADSRARSDGRAASHDRRPVVERQIERAHRDQARVPAVSRRLSPAFAFAAFALLALFLLSLWTVSLYDQVNRLASANETLQDEVTVLTGRVDDLTAQREILQQELDRQSELVALLAAPAQTLALSGTEPQPQAFGQFRILSDASAVLAVSQLEPLPAGRVYQLWLIHDDVPVPAGTFQIGSDGFGLLNVERIDSISTLDAIAVSEEPDGGSLEPTGDIVMFGEA